METEIFRQKNVYGKIGNVRLGIDQCLNQLVSSMQKHTNAEKADGFDMPVKKMEET